MPLHPAIAARLPMLDGIPSMMVGHADPQMRARIMRFQAWPGDDVPRVPTRAELVPTRAGGVPVRVYRPEGGGSDRPGLVWMHGGAFIGGDLDMAESDWTARELGARAGVVVVAVDYRLARGGVRYPAPHDDVVAAIRWTRDRAAELGIDPARLSVGGASAGANLAAGAALRLRDVDAWSPAALLLAYPPMHPVMPPRSAALAAAMAQVPELFQQRPQDRAVIAENYLGGPASAADGYAMPGKAELTGLCPTVVLKAEFDELRASGELFAAQLALAGVDVRSVTVRGVLHGFLNLPRAIEPVGRALDLLADTLTAG